MSGTIKGTTYLVPYPVYRPENPCHGRRGGEPRPSQDQAADQSHEKVPNPNEPFLPWELTLPEDEVWGGHKPQGSSSL